MRPIGLLVWYIVQPVFLLAALSPPLHCSPSHPLMILLTEKPQILATGFYVYLVEATAMLYVCKSYVAVMKVILNIIN